VNNVIKRAGGRVSFDVGAVTACMDGHNQSRVIVRHKNFKKGDLGESRSDAN